jgi:integrase
VFCDDLGQPIVGRRVERVFKQHLQRAGLPTDFTPYSLRHSCGTWLTAQRVPDRVVMGILGHSSPGMTARYQHVMQSMVDDAADQLAAIFPSAPAVLTGATARGSKDSLAR